MKRPRNAARPVEKQDMKTGSDEFEALLLRSLSQQMLNPLQHPSHYHAEVDTHLHCTLAVFWDLYFPS